MFGQKQLIQSKQVRVPGVGAVKITRRRKCKNLCIRVNKGAEIKVTIPFRSSFDEGEKFLFEKIDWIRKAIEKLSETDANKGKFSYDYCLSTRSRELRIAQHQNGKYTLRINGNESLILLPPEAEINSTEAQLTISNMVIEMIRNEAKEYLPKRTIQLAQQFGFRIADIRVKNATTRWGSCSAQNNINLNIHLVRLPDELSDYIILHELVHTVHKNHGPKFWDLLDKVSPHARETSKKLKKYKLGLFS